MSLEEGTSHAHLLRAIVHVELVLDHFHQLVSRLRLLDGAIDQIVQQHFGVSLDTLQFFDNLARAWLFYHGFFVDLLSHGFLPIVRVLDLVIVILTLCLKLVLRHLAIVLIDEGFLAPATLLIYRLVCNVVGVLAFRALGNGTQEYRRHLLVRVCLPCLVLGPFSF